MHWQHVMRTTLPHRPRIAGSLLPLLFALLHATRMAALRGGDSTGSMAKPRTLRTCVKAYRAQNWDHSDVLLLNLLRANAKKYLYLL